MSYFLFLDVGMIAINFPLRTALAAPHTFWLEKEMTTHSSILAWRIPWTEEPGGIAESDMTEHTAHVQFGLLYFHIHLSRAVF